MERNLAIMKVKPVIASIKKLADDIKKSRGFIKKLITTKVYYSFTETETVAMLLKR